ncbi:MAG: Na+/H+ antiporter NhaC family protein [Oscillospiraceae bacterium]|nr:Na+/H+ antiporter NhaC family protein [Oscillospiraceae bacterium]
MQDVGFWSLVPPLVAIVLAVLTKEVIFSLLCGILSGTAIYAVANHLGTMGCFSTTVELMTTKLGGNAAMILFLAMLGALVAVITEAGGSRAYADWAAGRFKNRRTATVATALFSVFLFIDDYFNCITSGTVMRPVTDRFGVSREKLSYIVDMMAASAAILAPISSWAASVMSYIPVRDGMTGMQAFLQAAPMNLYAVGTLFMVFWICIRKKGDYGPMAAAEARAQRFGPAQENADELEKLEVGQEGKVIDLVLPIGALIVFSILAMLYVGGYWSGEGLSLVEAFGATDAPTALALAGFGSLLVAFFLFTLRKKMTFGGFFLAVGNGVKSMVAPCIILTLAWSISGVCRELLGTGSYVARLVAGSGMPVQILPAIVMIVAGLLAFATGTSWGTFGILIPIVVTICEQVAPELTITALSAVLAGSVFGDQVSPISDVVILSSASAGCEMMRHVVTQLPYALTVALCAAVGYLMAGFTVGLGYGVSLILTLAVFFTLLVACLLILPRALPGVQKEPAAEILEGEEAVAE